ncbi:MAG: ABC transporter permease [Imperialibacter sp.]|uniref:ABC transporter permease n=1 Tax=Imperialibacter sp. TaxID=2038411 RepID=UPI0032ECF652
MHKIIINASDKIFWPSFKELKDFRDLFYVLALRDVKVRYAQTYLGFIWAFIQPLATLLIFTLIFGKAINVDTGGIPYPLFALVGMSCWTYFSYVLSQSGGSIIGAQEMIKKIYFPRLIIPLSKALVGLIDYGITLLMVLLLMLWYGYVPPSQFVFFPFCFLSLVIVSLGVGVWLSALSIRFRDFQHVVPFLVQFGLYATPVAYPARLVPEKYFWIYYSNPMAGVIELFRWCLLDGSSPTVYSYLSLGLAFIVFVAGIVYFKKVERVMADLV